MPNAAQVKFNITNLTQFIGTPNQGLSLIQGRSIRGPFNDPNTIINSWPAFVAKFGGLMNDSDSSLLAKRLLEKGGSIRFSRVGHYTDITDKATLDAVLASQPTVTILTLDAELVESNEIDFTLNTVAANTVNYTLSNDNTLDLLAEEIASFEDVGSAVAIDTMGTDGDNRQIFITPAGVTPISITGFGITLGASQAGEVITTATKLVNSNADELFEIVPKYEGADFNKFELSITPGSNGITNYFNLKFRHVEDPTIVEEYQNLLIPGTPTDSQSTYLDKVVGESKYFNVVYKDLSTLTEPIAPLPIVFQFTGGSDGSAVTVSDYIGDSASATGLYSFDEYDDAYSLAVFGFDNDAYITAASAYVGLRKDLIFFAHLPNSLTSASALMAKRASLNINDKHTYFTAGGVKITDPITSQTKEIAETADVLALVAESDKNFGEWYSFAGPNRGKIAGVLGVVNNFGSQARFDDLNNLANRQINMAVSRDGSVRLMGNFSGQHTNDQESFMNVVRLVLFLKQSMRPALENFLEEPNDIPTWKRIYYTVKPFLDGLITKRALYTYEWQGDQFASGLDSLQVNDATDVSNGKYKVNLLIKAIPSIQEISVNIILTPAGISFEIANELI